MICILHGYLLEGSGSNLWTRSVIQALCRTGETVHLVCQDPHPERYDFIAEAHLYRLDGTVETLLKRDVPYEGRCIMHKPQLGDTLPVYVWDKYEEFARVVPMVDLPTNEIEDYIARNVDVVMQIARDNSITVMQANHLVLMSVVAQRVGAALDIPYVIMPRPSRPLAVRGHAGTQSEDSRGARGRRYEQLPSGRARGPQSQHREGHRATRHAARIER
jgi:hypothetical protein